MFFRLLVLFTVLPLIELWLLISIGSRIGPMATIALVFGTGLLGAWLARSQGLQTWNKLQSEMAAGRIPSEALIDGLLILIAGAVLLTPGLLTDLAGFFLLMAEGRALIRQALAKRFETRLRYSQHRAYSHMSTDGQMRTGPDADDADSGPVIVVEQRELP